MRLFHLTGVVLGVLMSALPAKAQVAPAPLPPVENGTQYLVFFRSQPVGREEALVVRTADGWVVRGTSRLGQPIDITTRVAEIDYDGNWQPKSLLIDSIVRGQDILIKTTFAESKATNVIAVQGAPQTKVDTISADPVVLPNMFLGAYAGLARRLQGKQTGAELRAYVAPTAEVTVRVTNAVLERIDTPKGAIQAMHYSLTFNSPPPAGDLHVNLWADTAGALLRLSIPAQTLEMAREDIASAASRTTAFSIEGDENVMIPGIGFNIAGSLSKPKTQTPAPAVILIAGSGPTDRDETVAGIPVFGQIARDLVNAGFVVIRYDKRGVGQSGGRIESATIADYAEDAHQVLLWLEKRKEVDKDRIAVVGHSEGALVAMLAAARERTKVKAMVLIAGPSTSGDEIVMEQQKYVLSKMPIDEAQRREKVELQEKINRAVIKGQGWNDIPAAARRAADTPWFYSFLTFDPEKAMNDTRQPVLIVQGQLDVQVAPRHADRLAEFARARKNTKEPVEVVKLPGINHLLVPAKTGDIAEYGALGPDAKVSPEITSAIAAFLNKVMKD